jgi:hypothetical protein
MTLHMTHRLHVATDIQFWLAVAKQASVVYQQLHRKKNLVVPQKTPLTSHLRQAGVSNVSLPLGTNAGHDHEGWPMGNPYPQ